MTMKKVSPAINGEMAAFAQPGIPGMTKREYIAALVFTGSGCSAKIAVEDADKLLEELSK